VACVLALLLPFASANAAAAGDAARGLYLAKAGGCLACHTEDNKGATPFAGGRALKTPFGTFYGPNLTPHAGAGIGRWSDADFVRAMRHGVRPDGANYYPAFPYPSFTGITDRDLADLWAYLKTLPPDPRPTGRTTFASRIAGAIPSRRGNGCTSLPVRSQAIPGARR
jgi:mono/diheme cytochrome c family protein